MNSNPLSQAIEYFKSGRLGDAELLCRDMLGRNPDNAEANHLLGAIRFGQNKTEEALVFLNRAALSPAATAEMHNHYGAALNKLGRKNEAIKAFEAAVAANPGYADALHNLGVLYHGEQKNEQAIAALRQASALKPELLQAKANLNSIYHGVVPAWHFSMMDDQKRHDAYEAAIRRAAPGKKVLDIGTGAGLLALMAARAGAKSVTTCEAVPLISDLAKEIAGRNQMAGRIQFVAKKSTDMSVPADMRERAEVLVTETFSSGLITEGVLPTLEHAQKYLLAPGATIIPAAASVMGYLAGGPALQGMLFVQKVAGFDLSAFNAFAPSMLPVALDSVPHTALSHDVELVRFDLRDKVFPKGGVRLAFRATAQGVCAGIVQWIRLELDAHTRYENRPAPQSGVAGHWIHLVHRFPRLISVGPGDLVPVLFRHDGTQIAIDLME